MLQSLDAFCHRLAATPVSEAIQATEWVIPAVQTAHIVLVGALLSSVLMVNLRLLGVTAGSRPVAAVAARFLPVVWYCLPVLLATGATLIIAEPSRSLENPVFLLKMVLLMLAAVVTLGCQIPLRRDPRFWDRSSARRRLAAAVVCLSLPLWIAIVCAGRWIAYVRSH